MHVEPAINQLKEAVKRFKITIDCLSEEDAAFAPREGMYSVAYTVAHVAQTIPWFIDGAFNPKGFDLNFEEHHKTVREKSSSLAAAIAYLDKTLAEAVKALKTKTDKELLELIAPGPVMGGLPRLAIFEGITDHTASHRGSLAVYARLLGKAPKMPYS